MLEIIKPALTSQQFTTERSCNKLLTINRILESTEKGWIQLFLVITNLGEVNSWSKGPSINSDVYKIIRASSEEGYREGVQKIITTF